MASVWPLSVATTPDGKGGSSAANTGSRARLQISRRAQRAFSMMGNDSTGGVGRLGAAGTSREGCSFARAGLGVNVGRDLGYRSSTCAQPFRPRLIDGGEDRVQAARDLPLRVMLPYLRQVADVAEVIGLAGLLADVQGHRLTRQRFKTVPRLQDRATVGPAAAEVVDLGAARCFDKSVDEPGHVLGVKVVADLLTLVAVHRVRLAHDVTLDEVAQKAVQRHAGVLRSGHAAGSQTTGRQAERAAVLLHQ